MFTHRNHLLGWAIALLISVGSVAPGHDGPVDADGCHKEGDRKHCH